MKTYEDLVRPLLFALPPEASHTLTIKMLSLVQRYPALLEKIEERCLVDDARLVTQPWPEKFPWFVVRNPVGFAPGLDKHAEALIALLSLGVGFIEAGAVLRYSQPGNDKPRIFRLLEDLALINRLGFNSKGLEYAKVGLVHARQYKPDQTQIGVNLGVNKNRAGNIMSVVEDQTAMIEGLVDLVAFFVINVSSPNTPGLRDLQSPDAIHTIVTQARQTMFNCHVRKPLLVKFAPDMTTSEFDERATAAIEAGADGLILVNTTTDRDGLRSEHKDEQGGLSGLPLYAKMMRFLEHAAYHFPDTVRVACGGIDPSNVAETMELADLCQFYTSGVYGGPMTAKRMCEALLKQYA